MIVVLYATYLYGSPDRRPTIVPAEPPSELVDTTARSDDDDDEHTPALAEYQKSDGVR